MQRSNTYTKSQITAIKILADKKIGLPKAEQTKIRNEIRDVHKFYYSDFSNSKKGYNSSDIDNLINLGLIKIIGKQLTAINSITTTNVTNNTKKEKTSKIPVISTEKQSFAPISNNDTSILVLGTLPGDKSLELNEYYGHSRNRFWSIISNITNNPNPITYDNKKALLAKSKIGVWDIAHKASRKGSLDNDILEEEPNDLIGFISSHKNLKVIGFNGAKAEKFYDKYFDREARIKYVSLPSSSPANASINFVDICNKWKEILQ